MVQSLLFTYNETSLKLSNLMKVLCTEVKKTVFEFHPIATLLPKKYFQTVQLYWETMHESLNKLTSVF